MLHWTAYPVDREHKRRKPARRDDDAPEPRGKVLNPMLLAQVRLEDHRPPDAQGEVVRPVTRLGSSSREERNLALLKLLCEGVAP